MASLKRYNFTDFIQNNLALGLVAVTIILVERFVKFYVTENLFMYESIPVLDNILMITRIENTGAGFGMLSGQNWLFIISACIVLLMIVYFYDHIIYDRLLVFATAFILGGTVGNMMDRVFFGRVIDYIDLSFWPTFNLSDASLVVGISLLIYYIYLWRNEPEKRGLRIF